MSKRVVLRNVASNWAGTFFLLAAGFVIFPFLIGKLGETTYGLWMILGSFTGNFYVLDLGVRDSVGRFMALYSARGDYENVNTVLSTALAILVIVAAVAFVIVGVTELVFFDIFKVPEGMLTSARIAFFIIGLNMAISFPLKVFDGTLWAHQRFDVINMINIGCDAVRIGLTFYLLSIGCGLITLTVLTIAQTLVNAALKAFITFRINPQLAVGLRYVKRSAVRKLFGFGVWTFVASVGRRFSGFVSSAIIGAFMNLATVTPFSIPNRLIGYANEILLGATGVLTPMATTLHAKDDHARQQELCVLSGRFTLALTLYFFVGFVFLGRPFIRLWMGAKYEDTARFLIILSIGTLSVTALSSMGNIILSMARHKMLAYMRIINLFLLAHACLLALPHGLLGISVAMAAVSLFGNAIPTLLYGCHLLKLPLRRYAADAVLPAVLGATGPALVLFALTRVLPPANWFAIGAWGAVFSLAYAVSGGLIVARPQAAHLLRALRARVFRKPADERRETPP